MAGFWCFFVTSVRPSHLSPFSLCVAPAGWATSTQDTEATSTCLKRASSRTTMSLAPRSPRSSQCGASETCSGTRGACSTPSTEPVTPSCDEPWQPHSPLARRSNTLRPSFSPRSILIYIAVVTHSLKQTNKLPVAYMYQASVNVFLLL